VRAPPFPLSLPSSQLDSEAVNQHLRRLATAYPAFTFGYEAVSPSKGPRWVAERRDRKAPGTRVVITGDLLELHAALAPYKAACHVAR
jgi:hypothetical protein